MIDHSEIISLGEARKQISQYNLDSRQGRVKAIACLWGVVRPTCEIAKLVGCSKDWMYKVARELGLRKPGRHYVKKACRYCKKEFIPHLEGVLIQTDRRGSVCPKCSSKKMTVHKQSQRRAYYYALKLSLPWSKVAELAGYKKDVYAVNAAKLFAQEHNLAWPIPGRRSAGLKRAWVDRKEKINAKAGQS